MANIASIRVDDEKNIVIDATDRLHPDFAIVAAIISLFERQIAEKSAQRGRTRSRAAAMCAGFWFLPTRTAFGGIRFERSPVNAKQEHARDLRAPAVLAHA